MAFSIHTALSRRPHLPMPETGDYLKSLKPFREILVSSEANYRNAAADEHGVITGVLKSLQEMGKKTKRKTQPLQVYIVRRAWEKSHDESHDLRSHDELKIDDDIIKVSNQIRKF